MNDNHQDRAFRALQVLRRFPPDDPRSELSAALLRALEIIQAQNGELEAQGRSNRAADRLPAAQWRYIFQGPERDKAPRWPFLHRAPLQHEITHAPASLATWVDYLALEAEAEAESAMMS